MVTLIIVDNTLIVSKGWHRFRLHTIRYASREEALGAYFKYTNKLDRRGDLSPASFIVR